MRVMVFIPCYNDTVSAHRLSRQFEEDERVEKIMIVDDSDDPGNVEYSGRIEEGKTEVIRRDRSGKWSAWRLALERAAAYDGLVEVDSDVRVGDIGPLIRGLRAYDVVTAYQEIVVPPRRAFLSRRIGEVYRDTHRRLKGMGKFNMGGRAIALSGRAVRGLLDRGFFEEPVLADDHVICLASSTLGLRHTSLDCGLKVKAPSRVSEWMRYRSRHRGAIPWSEDYVSGKIGDRERVKRISRVDYGVTRKYFLKSLFESFHPLNIMILLLFGACSLLLIEDRVEWSKLKSTKFVQMRSLLFDLAAKIMGANFWSMIQSVG